TPRVGIVRTVGGIGVYGRTLVAEIPLAIGRRRHEVIKVVGNILAAPVFEPEKKGAVLPDRPANTEAVVVFLVTRLGSSGNVKIVVGVEGFVAGELPHRAVELV